MQCSSAAVETTQLNLLFYLLIICVFAGNVNTPLDKTWKSV